MADDQHQVKVHGGWLSPFNYRVICALKLKGIPFEMVKEDVSNKSALLLKYNPVHKLIPVLVHGGKPVCESMVILEYIEETWPLQNPLMPTDPHHRALARFWINFAESKGSAVWKLIRSIKDQENTVKEIVEMLQAVEEYGFLGEDKKFFNGDKIGLVDIAFASILYWLQVFQEIVGVKLFESHKFPKLNVWFENYKQVPLIEETFPNRDEMLAFFTRRYENLLASA